MAWSRVALHERSGACRPHFPIGPVEVKQFERPQMIVKFPTETMPDTSPRHVDPIAWHQALGYARQASARIFRDGGSPRDALAAFAIKTEATTDWGRAIDLIAQSLTMATKRHAA